MVVARQTYSEKEKISLSNLSIIFSVKIDSADRLNNFRFNVDYLHAHFSDLELVVVEQDGRGEVKECLDAYSPSVRSIYHSIDHDGVHYKTRNLNLATNLASREIIMMCDCDVLCPPEALHKAVQILEQESALISPHNGIMTEIAKEHFTHTSPAAVLGQRTFFTRDFNKNDKEPDYSKMYPLYGNENYFNMGGCILYRKRDFYLAGGWNTNMISYGFEDDEFVYRFKKLGYRHRKFRTNNIYHLQHERGKESIYNNFYRSNEQEYEHVLSMTEAELRHYALNGFKRIRYDVAKELDVINTDTRFSITMNDADKVDLQHTSIIVPVRIPDKWWLPPLNHFVGYLERKFKNYEVIIAEGDSKNCKYLPNRKNAKYIRSREKYDVGRYIRIALNAALYDTVAVWDFFTMISPADVGAAAQKVHHTGEVVFCQDNGWYTEGIFKRKRGNGAVFFSRKQMSDEQLVNESLSFFKVDHELTEATRLW